MMKFKRLTALFMVLMLLTGCVSAAHAADDKELTEDDLFAQWDTEADETDDVMLDEEGNEIVDDAAAATDNDGLSDEELAALEGADGENVISVDTSKWYVNGNLPTDVVNILLLGIDARDDVTDVGRSDAVMICSINLTDGSVKLSSILRDTLVSIPTKKNQYKITNAYRFGGAPLTVATVNQTFQMNIDKFVTINFYGLAAIIDSLGGVDIELSKTEASRINYELKKEPLPFDTNPGRDKVEAVAGVHHLDGMQAVTYARIRGIKGENDFNRTERQRKLLEVLLEQVMGDMSIEKMVNLIGSAMPYVLTNMSASDMATLGMGVLQSGIIAKAQSGGSLLEQFRVPMDETWKYATVNGSSVVQFRTKARLQENVEALHNFIYGQYYAAE